jgi:hypothetical protein
MRWKNEGGTLVVDGFSGDSMMGDGCMIKPFLNVESNVKGDSTIGL